MTPAVADMFDKEDKDDLSEFDDELGLLVSSHCKSPISHDGNSRVSGLHVALFGNCIRLIDHKCITA